MRDGGKIVGGLVIWLVVLAGPLWMAAARGVKNVALARASGGSCIEAPEEMRKNHPALLARWRERVLRSGERVDRARDGGDVRISLTATCLGCHGKSSGFCDRCHAQAVVSLSCWQCHESSALVRL